jgi:PAS domain S-box-containing protein
VKREKDEKSAKKTLRARTERITAQIEPGGEYSGSQVQDLMQELMVHQAELEIQNEELHTDQVELKQSKDRYFDLYDTAPIGYLTLDQHSTIAEINLTGAAILGKKRSQLIRKTFWRFVADEDRQKYHDHIEKARAGKIRRSCEVRLTTGQGGEIHVHMESLPWEDPQRNVTGFRSVLLDITERRRTEEELARAKDDLETRVEERTRELQDAYARISNSEEALQRQNALLKLAMEATNTGWGNWNWLTGEAEWSDESRRIMGFESDEEARTTAGWLRRVHPEDRHLVEAGIAQAAAEHRDIHLEYRVVHPDGGIRHVLGTSRILYDNGGRPVSSTGLITDITGRKRVEEEKRRVEVQLAQAQRIEALDKFAGGIAHDLNNILSPIIVNIEDLLENEPPGSARRDVLDETLKAAYRQRDLIKKILTFGRKSEQAVQPMQVGPLLEESLAFLRSSLPSTIRIEERVEAKADVIVGDPIQIQQVIMNLVQNAADALEEGKGTIEVRLASARLTAAHGHQGIREGEYLRLTVRDTGTGMKPEVMERIFDPFFTTKGAGRGTGMGLSITYGIVQGHGGTITAESHPGKGSTFKVYLPLCEAECEPRVTRGERASSGGGKEKILLVDDEELILSSMQRVLKTAGYEVTPARSGIDAIDLFSRSPDGFDLVITDMTMPGMTGVELARKLLGIHPGLPVILCTGYKDVISQQEAKRNGIRQLLLKPVGAGELKNVIHRALEN